MRNHSILTTGGQRNLGVESRLLGKAAERQMTVELGLEDSHHVDGGQGMGAMQREHFKQKNQQKNLQKLEH